MTVTYRQLAYATLSEAIPDPTNRYEMPMSTLIAGALWLFETTWDESAIGDVQVFKNANALPSGSPKLGPDGEPMAPEWVWWAGISNCRVKSYRFIEDEVLTPQTLVKVPNAQRQAKTLQARPGAA